MSSYFTPSLRMCPGQCGNLATFKFRELALDKCQVCAGIWFDGGEYEALSRLPEDTFHTLEELAIPTAQVAPHPGARRCPSCTVKLQPLTVSHLTTRLHLERCTICNGIWAEDYLLEVVGMVVKRGQASFDAYMPADIRDTVAQAVAQKVTPTDMHRSHILTSVVSWLKREI